MVLSKEFNKLKKLINAIGYLNSEKEINSYYENNKNEASILYKARLEFLKENFKKAIEIIENEYIPEYQINNNIIYFLALCYLELNDYEKVYEVLKDYEFTKDNKRSEEVKALKLYVEKKLKLPYSSDYKNNPSYLHNQIIKYDRNRVSPYNINREEIKFNVNEEKLNYIINIIQIHLKKIKPETSLDMFDKYYFYFPNIGECNGHKSNVFVVKALRNTNDILFIEPTVIKTKAFVHNFETINQNKVPDYIEEDINTEVEENGLFENESLINWLFMKFPYVKSVLTNKLELECALGNHDKALEIIENYYIPTFGFESSIYFFKINLLCNLEKYSEAYRLLAKKNLDSFVDDDSIKKYRRLKIYLNHVLGLPNNDIEPNSYVENQIDNYDFMSTIEFQLKENNHEYEDKFKLNLGEELTEEVLFDFLVKLYEELPGKLKTYRDNICDSYYFRKKNIGINEKDNTHTDILCVLTIKNTKDIIAIYPVKEKNWYRLNDLDYLRRTLKPKIYNKTGINLKRLK